MKTLEIKTRNYSVYEWVSETNTKTETTDPSPIPFRLFQGDRYDPDTQAFSYDSPIRKTKKIPGILILEGNRTYGRQNCPNKKSKKGRLYYRCIPYDQRIPCFLIPYEPPAEFSKHCINLFVLFEFIEWTLEFAPYGRLTETLGKVNDLPSYYQYLLHSRCLSFENTSKIAKKIGHEDKASSQTHNSNYKSSGNTLSSRIKSIEKAEKGLETPFVFSIDPMGSKDLDDAFSIHSHTHQGKKKTTISVYIADMVYWATELKIWEDLDLEKVGANTLYLPDRNRPMLPSLLSDQKASLLADSVPRPVMNLKWIFSEDGTLENVEPEFKHIVIHANYRYDTEEMEKSQAYQHLLKHTLQWIRKSGHEECIEDSHTLVSFWMIEYNREIGRRLSNAGKGIFRTSFGTVSSKIASTDGDTKRDTKESEQEWQKIIKYWKSDSKGEYRKYSSLHDEMRHEGIGWTKGKTTQYYVHASSPIRRLVDLYNQCCFLSLHQTLEEEASHFCQRIESALDELNRQTIESKRVQRECEMLAAFFSCPEISENEYTGVIIDIDNGKKGAWVYLLEWKRLVWVSDDSGQEELTIGAKKKCQIFLFEEEERSHKKVVVRFIDRENNITF